MYWGSTESRCGPGRSAWWGIRVPGDLDVGESDTGIEHGGSGGRPGHVQVHTRRRTHVPKASVGRFAGFLGIAVGAAIRATLTDLTGVTRHRTCEPRRVCPHSDRP